MGIIDPPGPSKASGAGGGAGPEQSGVALKLSCAECRRRKLRCDRKVPCNMCIKRQCQALCPHGVLPPKNAIKGSTFGTLQNRVATLEDLLKKNGIAIPPELKGKSASVKGKAAENGATRGSSSDDDGADPTKRAGAKSDESDEDDDWVPSFGTLELGKAGRARFVGATAGSLWLSNEHMQSGTPGNERHVQPKSGSYLSFLPASLKPYSRDGPSTYAQLRARLPPRAEALSLIDLYYMEYAWLHTVVTQSSLLSHFEAFYSADRHHSMNPLTTDDWTSETHPHKLALLFIAMAMGAYYDARQPAVSGAEPGRAQLYHAACVEALDLSSNDPTVASLQTLHIMANYHLSVDRIKGGDVVWSLWGLLMRQAVAMGMHRDGQRWNLAPLICDERRRVWWEIFTEDCFQSNCFGRPGGMTPKHFDTAFPEECDSIPAGQTEGYSINKYKMGRLANEVLDQVMCVTPPSYAEVKRLSKKITTFENSIPYFLRCRPALLVTNSAYPTREAATAASPEVQSSDKRLTYQQHTLSLNVAEAQFFLLRPFFARALQENPADPSKGRYGESYLCVAERCSIMITILMSLQSLYPISTPRAWYLWYHAASSACCMASLVISAPQSPLALFGWMNLQSVCNLFSSVATQAKSTMSSLTLLLKLREKASDAMSGRQVPFFKMPSPGPGNGAGSDDEGDSSNLIGLHTRLIERGNQGMARSRVFKGNGRSPSPRQLIGQPASQPVVDRGQRPGPSCNSSIISDSQLKRETQDQSLAEFIESNPFGSQPGQQPWLPTEEFLYQFSQSQAVQMPTAMDTADEMDSQTADILSSLWPAPQSTNDNDWSSANLDLEQLGRQFGISFLPPGQAAAPTSLEQQHQQVQQLPQVSPQTLVDISKWDAHGQPQQHQQHQPHAQQPSAHYSQP